MQYTAGELYHIYNRGNNKQRIFFGPADYECFLKKVKKYITPNCDVLNFSLMPNHFHFLIHATDITARQVQKGVLLTNPLSEGFRQLLSSYTKIINIRKKRTGHLFQQNTKAKLITEGKLCYGTTCFHYIHQNPVKAGLVVQLEEWPYSSFRDYTSATERRICNKPLAMELLNLEQETIYHDSYGAIDDASISRLFKKPGGALRT